MRISFENIIPEFLEEYKINSSEVWKRNFEISSGEKLQIVAPSGRGKSSLVQFLYGTRKDYGGDIKLNGTSIKQLSAEKQAEVRQKHFSIIFQDLRLFPDHSVWDNISIKHKLSPYDNESTITTMAKRLGIENKLQQAARHCSYGEQQRIAIIRALQQPYDLLIMDEPFSHLDDNNRAIAMELILEESDKRNAAIILADLKLIEYFPAAQVLNL